MTIKFLWWNINKRLYLYNENVSITPFRHSTYDIIFIFETNLVSSALPKIDNYTALANPNLKYCTHGGIAVFVKNTIIKNVFDLTHNACYIAFRLDTVPSYIFGGVYIQPENSRYFTPNMFAELDTLLSRCVEYNYTPYIGGDFNSRLGDLNILSTSWHYHKNVDQTTNKHGRTYMTDICKRNYIYPINHLKYNGMTFKGDFTYFKNEKKSQIDFVLTNNNGRKYMTSFEIINYDWHISDHKPTSLEIHVDSTISSTTILARAENMNYEYSPQQIKIQRYNKNYNFESINDYIQRNKEKLCENVSTFLQENNIEPAVDVINNFVKDMHQYARKTKNTTTMNNNLNIMNNANEKFKKYCEHLANGSEEYIRLKS